MDEEVFQVEKILGKRREHGVDKYLIKWQGYSKAHNTWEPKANILDPNLVALFEAEWAANKAPERASGGAPGGEAKAPGSKRARTSKAPPPAHKPSAAAANGGDAALDDEDSAYRIDLRQHLEELCTLRLVEALQPSGPSRLRPSHALAPADIFASVRDACPDAILTVKDRARLVDVQEYLADERVRPLMYVWGAEIVADDDASADLAHERIACWAKDLVKRERAAVVQLPRQPPLGSDLFIVPPACAAWEDLVDAGAALGSDARLALVLVCASDEADAAA